MNTKLQNRIPPSSGVELTSRSTVSALAQQWLLDQEDKIARQSWVRYRDVWNKLCAPALGELLINEVRVSAVDACLTTLAKRTPGNAKLARVVCLGVFGKAVRLELMQRNPVREISLPRHKREAVRSVTIEELTEIRRRVSLYCRHEEIDEAGLTRKRPGPKPGQDLQDIMDLLIATGARIGEILALLHEDVFAEAMPPTVVIGGTLVVPRAAGEKLWRQPHRKGEAPPLTLILPEFGADVLRRRAAAPVFLNPHSAVFVTSTGNWLSPSNVRRNWRAALGSDFGWVKPHSFRKTVATLIKAKYGVETAQSQLGHSSTRVTEAHYIERMNSAPDTTGALDEFTPHLNADPRVIQI
ncbi:site-specific integrase [Rhodococcus sp. B10]|uniref:tyrosine-type recombinase/integrase n=1 Tax=Rhodococcus sp. B10 TaxID=2695876 RepID=UPI00143069DD|nr:site-specific integrase [Rhodococcus sp. B10]